MTGDITAYTYDAAYTTAQHLRCFLHFRENVERKLRELSLPSSVSIEIVKDIMGCPGKLQRGLVDAFNEEQLDGMLSNFITRWNTFEAPYNSPPLFYTWFMKHCRDVIVRFMLRSVREKAGLGSPPAPYYTNEVESMNKLLKEEVSYTSSQLPDFVEKMRSLFKQQKSEIQ